MSLVISCNSVDVGYFCSLFLFCCYLVDYIMSHATNVVMIALMTRWFRGAS